MAAPEVEADAADAEHRAAVDARVRTAIEGGASTWSELLARTEGADPRLVAARLRALGLVVPGLDADASDLASRWTPELHARDFEWYFTPTCARALAAHAAGSGRRVLCLGTPTVALALLDRSPPPRVTLVDANPLVPRRHPGIEALELIVEELDALRLPPGGHDVAVFDAPWYPAPLARWLAAAARAVGEGGHVWFALLPRLHRPTAGADRASMLAAARGLGSIEIEPATLRYQSPRFEREALATVGLAVPDAWRCADLIHLRVERPPTAEPLAAPRSESPWARFVIGSQVVHLDLHASAEPGDLLTPIDGRADFRYASISTRDPGRARIGLWTSRSRVATVRQPARVAALLDRLADGGELRALEDASPLRGLPPPTRASLLRALRTVLGLP